MDGLGRVREYAIKHGVPTNFGIGASGASVDFSRNIAVSHAIKANPRPTHLLMVDDDILMPEGTIPALLACDAGIAGGCYPAIKRVREGENGKRRDAVAPIVMVRRNGEWSPGWFDGIVDAEVVPGGCMMIRTDVIDALGFPWFKFPQELSGDGVITNKTEDVDICDRARAAGFAVRAHGGVRCSHMNRIDLSLFVAPVGCSPRVPLWTGPELVEATL